MRASLNHVFRTIWSDALNTWVAVPEIAMARGKCSRSLVMDSTVAGGSGKFWLRPLLVALACSYGTTAMANPVGPQVVSGMASFNQSGNVLSVTNSPNAIINWQSFSIAGGQTTSFIQQSANSAVLNRVVGPDPSTLLGNLTSNGKVFLINPAGILVGQGARISVPGFVASTLNLSDADFRAGRLRFVSTLSHDGDAMAAVINRGEITTPDGGTVYLVAPRVENSGVINTPNGETVLAAGNNVALIDTALPGVSVQIAGSGGSASNLGQILADSGRVGMVGAMVDNSGKISADSLVRQGGDIYLKASQGVKAGGSITANGTTGGTIAVLGDRVEVTDGATLAARGWHGGGAINVGGGWQGSGGLQQATVTTIARSVTLDASAVDDGNGGRVVAWSDVRDPASQTRVYGVLQAKGGANGGNGGRIETSGHWLDVAGITANASAAKGAAGEWLLDPNNIMIQTPTATTAGPTFPNWTSTTDSSVILNTDIDTQLNAGTSVTIATGTGAPNTQLGDINVNANITKSAGGNATLTLQAHNDINIAAGVSIGSTVGALNVTLNSDSDASGAGAITMKTGSSIATNGGNIVMGGGATPTTGYAVGSIDGTLPGACSQSACGISLEATTSLTSGGGNITLHGKSFAGTASAWNFGVSSLASINSGTGTIAITGISQGGGSSNAQGMALSGGSLTSNSTSPNAITLTGQQTTGSTNSTAIGVNIQIPVLATGAGGGISITGTGGTTSNTSTVGSVGIFLSGASILASSGTITLTGTNGTDPNSSDVMGWSGGTYVGQKAASTITSSISPIVVNANTLSLTGTDYLQSSGPLAIQPRTAGTTIGIAGGAGTLSLPASYFSTNFATGFATISVGDPTFVSGAITVGGATAANDNLDLISGSTIAINASLGVAAGKTLGLAGTTVSGNGNLTATNLVLGPSGTYTLNTAAANNVGTLAAGTAGLSFANSGALNIGSIGPVNGVTATGPVSIETASGDITVAQNISTTDATAAAVLLNAGKTAAAGTASGGNIVVTGTATIAPGAGGRATLMTGSVAGSTGLTTPVGSGSGNFRYNSDETTTNYTKPLGAGVFAIYREQPVLSVAPAGASSVYGSPVTLGTANPSGYVNGDSATTVGLAGTGSVSTNATSSSPVGTYSIVYTGNYTNTVGYAITASTGGYTITPVTLTVTGLSGTNRTYDGTTVDALTGTPVLSGLVNGETLTLNGASSGTLASAHAGSQVVTTAITLANGSGLASNYVLTQPTLPNVTIAQAPVSVTGLAGVSRTYDGTTSVALSGTPTFSGLVNSETLTLVGANAGTLASAHVGSQPVSAVITLANGSGLASDYVLTQPVLPNVTIAPAPLTVTGLSVTGRAYNGSAVIALSGTPVLSGLVNGETLSFSGTSMGRLASAHAGSQAVTTAITLANGTGLVSDYVLTQTTLPNVTITPIPLSVTGLSGTDRAYDGTTVDALSGTPILSGLVNGETLKVDAPKGVLASAHAGSQTVTSVISLANGTGLASDYTLTQPVLPKVTISPAQLTLTGTIGGTLSKPYDGTTTATGAVLNGTVSGGIAGDVLALDTSGYQLDYNSAHVSTANTISATGKASVTVTSSRAGSLPGDYSVTKLVVSPVPGHITPATLTVSLKNTGLTKIYDGSTGAPAGFTPDYAVTGLVRGDTAASLSFSTAAYNSAHVSAANSLTLSGLGISTISGGNGSEAGDYVLAADSLSAPASITARALTSTASIGGTLSKEYDGTTAAPGARVVGTVDGGISGDTLALDTMGYTLAYSSPDIAAAVPINATGTAGFIIAASAAGSQPGDYSFSGPNIAAVQGSIVDSHVVQYLVATSIPSTSVGTQVTSSFSSNGIGGTNSFTAPMARSFSGRTAMSSGAGAGDIAGGTGSVPGGGVTSMDAGGGAGDASTGGMATGDTGTGNTATGDSATGGTKTNTASATTAKKDKGADGTSTNDTASSGKSSNQKDQPYAKPKSC